MRENRTYRSKGGWGTGPSWHRAPDYQWPIRSTCRDARPAGGGAFVDPLGPLGRRRPPPHLGGSGHGGGGGPGGRVDASRDLYSVRVLGRGISNACARLETLGAGIGDSLFGMRVYPLEPLVQEIPVRAVHRLEPRRAGLAPHPHVADRQRRILRQARQGQEAVADLREVGGALEGQLEALGQLLGELDRRRRQAGDVVAFLDRHRDAEQRARNMTFRVSGQAKPRLFPFDIVPRVVAGEDWSGLRAGLIPRSRALNPFLADVYDERQIVADGVIPSNEDRGYVLRRIIRRAIRFAYLLGVERPVLPSLVERTIGLMGDAYPEIVDGRDLVLPIITREEESFRRTLVAGSQILDEGRVVGTGRHHELMAGNDTYREIVLSQLTEAEAA